MIAGRAMRDTAVVRIPWLVMSGCEERLSKEGSLQIIWLSGLCHSLQNY